MNLNPRQHLAYMMFRAKSQILIQRNQKWASQMPQLRLIAYVMEKSLTPLTPSAAIFAIFGTTRNVLGCMWGKLSFSKKTKISNGFAQNVWQIRLRKSKSSKVIRKEEPKREKWRDSWKFLTKFKLNHPISKIWLKIRYFRGWSEKLKKIFENKN